MIGKQIGRYRVDSLLGSGGMGVVYSATSVDSGLPAAVKVLSEKTFGDPEHRRRFLAESRTAGALRHENIVRVHEAGSAEVDGVEVLYIAMDRVDGSTLEERIKSGAIPYREAAQLAAGIASGLAAAHAAGVVHRDVKPGNVMIAAGGVPKLLDFGLAKRMAVAAEASSQTVTIAQSVTMSGMIVGTVAYMAPEQAEAKPVDHRADVFSFGAVLYEMLGGKRAFGGDSQMAVLSSVLLKEPDPLPDSIPAPLRRVVERCLRKDPRRRAQSMADVRVALEDALLEPEAPPPAPPPAPPVPRTRRWVVGAMAGSAVGAAGGAFAARSYYRKPPASFQRLTFRRGDVLNARFGPSGAVVFSAAWDSDPPRVFVGQPGNREARALGVPPCNLLSISSKSELAVILGSDRMGTLATVPYGGGEPHPRLEHVNFADWSPDGSALAISRRHGNVYRVEYPAGTTLHESERPSENVRVSPDGSTVAFYAADNASGDYSIAVCGPDRKVRLISRGWRAGGGLEWRPDGRELLFSASRNGGDPAVYAAGLDGRERVVFRTSGWLHLMDIGAGGAMLMGAAQSRLGIVAATPFGPAPRDLAWLEASRVLDLSADGALLLFAELSYGDGRNPAIYTRKTDGSPAIQIGVGSRATLSRDGKWTACVQQSGDGPRLALLPVLLGEARVLPPDGIRYDYVEAFGDGRRLLCAGAQPGRPPRTWIRALDGKPEPATPEGVRAVKLAPNESEAVSVEKGKFLLRRLDGGAPREIAAAQEGEIPVRWSADGRHLFVALSEHGARSVRISRIEVGTGRREPWRTLDPPEPGAVFWAQPVLSADGKYHAMSFRRDTSDLYLVSGLA